MSESDEFERSGRTHLKDAGKDFIGCVAALLLVGMFAVVIGMIVGLATDAIDNGPAIGVMGASAVVAVSCVFLMKRRSKRAGNS